MLGSLADLAEYVPRLLPEGRGANYFGEGTPGTNRQPMLAGTRCSPAFNLSGHPRMGSTVTLSCENSSGAATSALVVMGASLIALPFVSGALPVALLLTIGVPMPSSVSPFVHDHELQFTTTLPGLHGVTYVQILQLDGGAPGGVSFTSGMRLEISS